MWPLVTYSNYFEILSTVTFLDSRTGLISGIFLYKSVLLYHYILNNEYTRYYICSAWFLDIVILYVANYWRGKILTNQPIHQILTDQNFAFELCAYIIC